MRHGNDRVCAHAAREESGHLCIQRSRGSSGQTEPYAVVRGAPDGARLPSWLVHVLSLLHVLTSSLIQAAASQRNARPTFATKGHSSHRTLLSVLSLFKVTICIKSGWPSLTRYRRSPLASALPLQRRRISQAERELKSLAACIAGTGCEPYSSSFDRRTGRLSVGLQASHISLEATTVGGNLQRLPLDAPRRLVAGGGRADAASN
jgi:hypothetical protein